MNWREMLRGLEVLGIIVGLMGAAKLSVHFWRSVDRMLEEIYYLFREDDR